MLLCSEALRCPSTKETPTHAPHRGVESAYLVDVKALSFQSKVEAKIYADFNDLYLENPPSIYLVCSRASCVGKNIRDFPVKSKRLRVREPSLANTSLPVT
jgi:hypothetical protein